MHLRALAIAFPLALLMAFVSFLLPLIPFAAAPAESLLNPDFQAGFSPDGLALGWRAFYGGPGASFRWSAALPLFTQNDIGQVLQLSTLSHNGSSAPQYIGIYQVADLVPGGDYRLAIRGMLHTSSEKTGFNRGQYQVQWAVHGGSAAGLPAAAAWESLSFGDCVPGLPCLLQIVCAFKVNTAASTLWIRLFSPAPVPDDWAALELWEVSLQGPRPRL